jgi:transcription elongation GreA/GreB family factor
MSRAFTREIDDAPPPPLPERPISAAPNLVTERGAVQIERIIAELTARLETASSEEAAGINRDLRYWTNRHATMQVVRPDPAAKAVGFGSRVTLKRGGRTMTLTLVGEDEADPARGCISWTSPLAEALMGAEPGETVDFETGDRIEPITVLSVASAA